LSNQDPQNPSPKSSNNSFNKNDTDRAVRVTQLTFSQSSSAVHCSLDRFASLHSILDEGILAVAVVSAGRGQQAAAAVVVAVGTAAVAVVVVAADIVVGDGSAVVAAAVAVAQPPLVAAGTSFPVRGSVIALHTGCVVVELNFVVAVAEVVVAVVELLAPPPIPAPVASLAAAAAADGPVLAVDAMQQRELGGAAAVVVEPVRSA
jgi:hypothetical protein